MKKINEQFSTTSSIDETKRVAERRGIQISRHYNSCDFDSPTVTIKGKTSETIRKGAGADYNSKVWLRETEEIPGLFCANCGAQGYYTDFKQIAVCGACPGWYFFYERVDQEKKEKSKIRYVLRNGELVAIDDAEGELQKDQL